LSLQTSRADVTLAAVTTERHPAIPIPTATRELGVFVYDGMNMLDCTGPVEVFNVASQILAAQHPDAPSAYKTTFISIATDPVRASSGIRMLPDITYQRLRRVLHTLIVVGGDVSAIIRDASVLAWIRKTREACERTASVCTGAFALAEAGLLEGRRATTHWAYAEHLAARYPSIDVDPDALFVAQDGIYTSAGVTAGMDLALALVEEDYGRDLALNVARSLVLFLKRPGGQSQFSAHLSAQSSAAGRMQQITQWIVEHPSEHLTVEGLAARSSMSPRNFARVFVEEIGMTPAKFVEKARVDQARRDLEDSELSLEEIAAASGFGSGERMRRTFQRHLNVVPQDYRRRFERTRDVSPHASTEESAS
jgi:transcriptional regulator GlxA family with amidase domain